MRGEGRRGVAAGGSKRQSADGNNELGKREWGGRGDVGTRNNGQGGRRKVDGAGVGGMAGGPKRSSRVVGKIRVGRERGGGSK